MVSWEVNEGGVLVPVYRDKSGRSIDVAWAPQEGSQEAFLGCPVFEVLYHGDRGPGKRIKNNHLALTDSGWKRVGDVTYDDMLVAPDGTYTPILGIFPHETGTMWRVTFDDGAYVDVDDDHRWTVLNQKTGYREGWCVRTTKQIRQAAGKYYIPTMSQPAPGTHWAECDPYIAGLLLGDGTMHKAVPERLRMADPISRLGVLQGLMDSDGSVDIQGRCRFVSLSEQLAKDVQYLVRSLGGKAKCYREHRPSPRGGHDWRWRVNVQHCNKFNPFRLPRKSGRVKPMKGVNRAIVSIERVDDAPATCFTVAHPSHLFVVQDFIVTHNTDALLMDWAQHVGRGYGQEWRGILFRRTYPELEDVIAKSRKWFPLIFPGSKFNSNEKTWHMRDGETLKFRQFMRLADYDSYHGHAYPWIAWEELTNWADPSCYLSMMSCSRSTVKGMPRKYRATTNPYGVGHTWIKRRFGLPHPGRMIGRMMRDPATNLVPNPLPRIAIQGRLKENKILLHADPDYIAKIVQAAGGNEAKLKAWLEGDWSIIAGGMFSDRWRDDIHVVPSIPARAIPRGWRIDRAYDHGQSHPFSVGWYAESDGNPIQLTDKQGRAVEVGTLKGDVIKFAEWYGCGKETNSGLNMLTRDIANGIKEREADWSIFGRVKPGPADSQIFARTEGEKSVGKDFAANGINWVKCVKGPDSRILGWQKVNDYLAGAIPTNGYREHPGLFVTDRCFKFIELFPVTPRDLKRPDDVDTNSEDHLQDETRYRLYTGRATVGKQVRK